jgi:hypothetical protein
MKDLLALAKLNVKLMVIKLKIIWVKLLILREDFQKRLMMAKLHCV